MSVIFADVTDIAIPEGNVIKIAETNGGRVLWEKVSLTINPSWKSTNAQLINPHRLAPIKFISRALSDSRALLLFAATEVNETVNNTLDTAGAGTRITNSYIDDAGSALLGSNRNVRFIAASKDIQPNLYNNKPGLLIVYSGNTNNYGFIPISSSKTNLDTTLDVTATTLNITSSPARRVYITLAPDRNEFLITGWTAGSLILPMNFTSSTSINFNSYGGNFLRTCRAPDLGLYFASSVTTPNCVYYSIDGISWNSSFPFSTGRVLGVEYISEKKIVCAINASTSQIALSNDGKTWEVKSTPFSNALAYDYSPDYNFFCIVNNKAAYVTQNFSKWFSANLPNSVSVEFTDLLYTYAGAFLAYKIGDTQLYFLFTDNVLDIWNSWE